MCIDAGHYSLAGGFFVTGCSINLAREKQVFNFFSFQAVRKLGRWKVVVFYSIAGPEKFYIFKPFYFTESGILYLFGQGSRESVYINFHSIPSFRLYK